MRAQSMPMHISHNPHHWTSVYDSQLWHVSACLGGFTDRSYTHTSWHTKVGHSSKSLTCCGLADKMIHIVRKNAADLPTTVYLGKW